MAEHPAVAAARATKGAIFQCSLVLIEHHGAQPLHRKVPSKAELNPDAVLGAIVELGWELVQAAPWQFPESNALSCLYVFRWVGSS